MARSPHDGRPYYCKSCGVGYAEWMACEDGPCELESTKDAQDRQRSAAVITEYDKKRRRLAEQRK